MVEGDLKVNRDEGNQEGGERITDHLTVNSSGCSNSNIEFSPSTAPLRPTLRLERLLLPSHPSLYSSVSDVCVCVCVCVHKR